MTRAESNWIKFVAIVLMLTHHLFSFPERISQCFLPQSFIGVDGTLFCELGSFGKICVACFAFLNGYLIWENRDKYKHISYRLKKAISLLIQYWVILVLMLTCGYLMSEPIPGGVYLLANTFGFWTGNINVYFSVNTGWYVGFYLIVLLLTPLFFCKHRISIPVGMVLYISIIGLKFSNIELGLWKSLVNNLYYYFPIVVIGLICSKYKILKILKRISNLICTKINNNVINVLISVMCMAIVILIRKLLSHFVATIIYPDWICIVPFICSLMGLYRGLKLNDGNPLKNFSKHITNIWLIHSFIFSPNKSMQVLAYWPKYYLFILLWMILLCWLISIIITPVQSRLIEVCNNKIFRNKIIE